MCNTNSTKTTNKITSMSVIQNRFQDLGVVWRFLLLHFGFADAEGAHEFGGRSDGAVHDNPQRFHTDVHRVQGHAHAYAERVDARLIDDVKHRLEGFVRHEGDDIQVANLQDVR